MDQMTTGRISIAPPMPDDDAGMAYQQVAENRAAEAIDVWLRDTGEVPTQTTGAAPVQPNADTERLLGEIGTSPAATTEGAGVKPADPATDQNADPQPSGYITTDPSKPDGGIMAGAFGVADYIRRGLGESPKQAVGGVIDALGEMDQFMQELVPIGGMQLYNDKGEFDPSLVGPDTMKADLKAEENIFQMIAPAEPDTAIGGFTRATAQFLTGFIPGLQATKGMTALKGGAILSNLTAGALADAVVFDPNEDRLSTFLNQIPALDAVVPDYLASNDPDEKWSGRLKNAIEGAGLGLATDALLGSFRYYKASRRAKAADKAAADPTGALVKAADDELKRTAGVELVNEIPDEALRPLGDPNAPMLIEAQPSETVKQATERLQAARVRAAKSDKDLAALDQVNSIRERFAAKKGITPENTPAGVPVRDPMDELLDEVRSGAVTKAANLPKRPVSTIVKNLGGVDPNSSLAGDLRSRGISAKSFPGLFRKGGRESLDNIPATDHPLMAGRGTDANGYVEQQAWIDGLEAELKGDPYRTAEDQAALDLSFDAADDFERHLDSLGIDYRSMSNERVKERLREISDEEAMYKKSLEEEGLFSSPRTQQDIWDQQTIEEAVKNGVDNAVIDAHRPNRVYLNTARINSADDVRAVLQEMANAEEATITAKTRGVVSNKQTIKESSKEYQDLNDLLGRAPGPMDAAKATAARRLLASSGEQLVQLAKIAKAENATPADLYNFRRAVQVHYALQSEVIAARTETARALQAWSIPVGASKARSMAINELISKEGGSGSIQDLARKMDFVSNDPAALNNMVEGAGKGAFGKALYQVWINGLLSSPKTHAVNMLSNSMTALWAIPERYMAAGISKAFYNGEIYAGETTAQAFGLVKGIRDGMKLIYLGNKADANKSVGDIFDAFVQVEGTQVNAISAEAFGLNSNSANGWVGYGFDMMSKLVNAPGAALNNEDKLFKSVGYRMELQSLAYRQAMSEGLDGKAFASRVDDIIRNPPQNLKVEAIDASHYQTFTTPLGAAARQMLGGAAKTPLIGPIFKVVMPFVKTPTNIFKYTFERTPLAYGMGKVKADIAAGGARAAQAHARVAMGSMVFLTMMDMFSEGNITGAGPLGDSMNTTQGVRSTRRAVGAPPPYSIKLGDRWYAYNRLDPIGMLVGMGADLGEVMGSASDADNDELAMAGVIAIAQNLASKRYLQGVVDFMGAIDPTNPGGGATKYLQNFTGSLVPYSSFLRNMAQTVDPVGRDPKDATYLKPVDLYNLDDGMVEPDGLATFWQNSINRVKKGIPGLSDDLPPMRDLYGEPISTSSNLGWGWDFISPVASKADNPDPVTKVITDNRISIQFPERSIGGVQLTADEYDEYSATSGKMAKEMLDRVIASPAFQKLSGGPDGDKAQMIKNTITESRKSAQGLLMRNNPDFRDRTVGAAKLTAQKTLTGN